MKEFDERMAHDCTASKERTKSEMIFIYILITHFSEGTISYTVYQYVKLIIRQFESNVKSKSCSGHLFILFFFFIKHLTEIIET